MPTATPHVVTLRGEYDIYNRPALYDALSASYDFPNVIIDFSAVRYMDSTALSELVMKRKRRADRGFAPALFVGLSPNLRQLLHVAGLERVWAQYDTMSAALNALDVASIPA